MFNKIIRLKICSKSFKIKLNEFWYFNHLIKNVEYFFSKNENYNKLILLKIPGTGRFIRINKNEFNKVKKDVLRTISDYEKNYFINKINEA